MTEKTISVVNRAASIRVVASLDGRPIRVDIDPGEYANGGDLLAIRVLELCKLAAARALALRRAELEEWGFDANLLARLGLPAGAVESEEEGEPQSWLARV